jgi:hypothetical protein
MATSQMMKGANWMVSENADQPYHADDLEGRIEELGQEISALEQQVESTASGKFTCQKCGHVQDWNMVVGLVDPMGYPPAIPVSERPPDEINQYIDTGYCDNVLALVEVDDEKMWLIGNHKDGHWRIMTPWGWDERWEPTHWLPMPPNRSK